MLIPAVGITILAFAKKKNPKTKSLRNDKTRKSSRVCSWKREINKRTTSHHHTYYVTSSYILCHILQFAVGRVINKRTHERKTRNRTPTQPTREKKKTYQLLG